MSAWLAQSASTWARYDCRASSGRDPARWIERGTRPGALLREPDPHRALAICGAGVFGIYLAPRVGTGRSAITCFPFEQYPFNVDKTHTARTIGHPRQVPPAVIDVLLHLNLGRARQILAEAGLPERRGPRFFLP